MELARLGGLRVISRTFSAQYKGTQKPLLQIRQELNVDAVVVGTVERSGERIHIRTQLVSAETGEVLKAQGHDRDLSDILRLEREFAQDIAQLVRVHLAQ